MKSQTLTVRDTRLYTTNERAFVVEKMVNTIEWTIGQTIKEADMAWILERPELTVHVHAKK